MSVSVECVIKHETDRALLVRVEETGEEVWLPLSQVEEVHHTKPVATVVITDWIAEQKGLA